jgi:DnaK suppressor protein
MDTNEAREALAGERSSTAARLASLRAEFDAIVSGAIDANLDDEHDPEGSTIAFERAQLAALMAEAEGYLVELEAARARVDDGTYAVCEGCGEVINDDRLRARPATRTCVLCPAGQNRRSAAG